MKKAYRELPPGYRMGIQLNLETNRHLRLEIAAAASLIILVMGLYGNHLQPLRWYFHGSFHQVAYAFLGTVLYMIFHELMHGLFMRIFSGEGARYSFGQPFAAARSNTYFHKRQYQIIALAPVVIWGSGLGLLCWIFRSTDWFWPFYFVEMVNLSGAVSDFYVVWKFRHLSRDALLKDTGTAIAVYEKV